MKSIPTVQVSLAILLVAGAGRAAMYNVFETFQGASFLDGFSFFSQSDPTHGRVNYVTMEEALSLGLAFPNGDSFILRADDTTTLSSGGSGRNSFHIMTNNVYGTHVSLFNVQHMPEGCGTWPAMWELGNAPTWPDGGEVDIVEGVNNQEPNLSSLHTSQNCLMPASRDETGSVTGLNCFALANNNAGCGVHTTLPNNFGPSFNNNGGGWYALERTPTFLKIWFWPRDASNVPPDVRSGSSSINTDGWGRPTAFFPDTHCDISSKFTDSNIIINLTFCGDWAGAVFGASGCPGDCVDFVNNNPGAFSGAFFEFNWVKVYQ